MVRALGTSLKALRLVVKACLEVEKIFDEPGCRNGFVVAKNAEVTPSMHSNQRQLPLKVHSQQ